MDAVGQRYRELSSMCLNVVEAVCESVRGGIAPSLTSIDEATDALRELRGEYESLRTDAIERGEGIDFDRSAELPWTTYVDVIRMSGRARRQSAIDDAKNLIRTFLSIESGDKRYADALTEIKAQAEEDLALLDGEDEGACELALQRCRMRDLFIKAVECGGSTSEEAIELFDEVSGFLESLPWGFKIYQGLILGRYNLPAPEPVVAEAADEVAGPSLAESKGGEHVENDGGATDEPEATANEPSSPPKPEDVESSSFRIAHASPFTFKTTDELVKSLRESAPESVRCIVPLLMILPLVTWELVTSVATLVWGFTLFEVVVGLYYLDSSGIVLRMMDAGSRIAYSLTREGCNEMRRPQVRKLTKPDGEDFWKLSIEDVEKVLCGFELEERQVMNWMANCERLTTFISALPQSYRISVCLNMQRFGLKSYKHNLLSVLYRFRHKDRWLLLVAPGSMAFSAKDDVVFVPGPVDCNDLPSGFTGLALQVLDGEIVPVKLSRAKTESVGTSVSSSVTRGNASDIADAGPKGMRPSEPDALKSAADTASDAGAPQGSGPEASARVDKKLADDKGIGDEGDTAMPVGEPRPLGVPSVKQFKREVRKAGFPVAVSSVLPFLACGTYRSVRQVVTNGELFGQGEDDIMSAIDYLVRNGFVARHSIGEYDEALRLTEGAKSLVFRDGMKNLKSGGVSYWKPRYGEGITADLSGLDDDGALRFMRQVDKYQAFQVAVSGRPLGEFGQSRDGGGRTRGEGRYDGDHFVVSYSVGGKTLQFVLLSPQDEVPKDAENLMYVLGNAPVDDLPAGFAGSVLQVTDGVIEEVLPAEGMAPDLGDEHVVLEGTDDLDDAAGMVLVGRIDPCDDERSEDFAEGSITADEDEGAAGPLVAEDDEGASAYDSSRVGRDWAVRTAALWAESRETPRDGDILHLARAIGDGYLDSADDPVGVVGMAVAYTLLGAAALSEDNVECAAEFRRLDLATRLGIGRFENSGSAIAEAFTGHESSHEPQLLAAYLNAMIRPSMDYDWVLHDACKTYYEGFDSFFPSFPSLRGLFKELRDTFLSSYEAGNNTKVIAMMSDQKKAEDARSELAAEALEYMTKPSLGSMGCLAPFQERVFGELSRLGQCIRIVAENKVESRETVEDVVTELSGLDAADIVDLWWDDMLRDTNVKGPDELVGPTKRKAAKEIANRLSVMRRWLDVTSSEGVSRHDIEALRRRRKRIVRSITSILKKGGDGTDGLPPVIQWCLLTIRAELSSSHSAPKPFEDFLVTGTLSIGERGVPVLDRMLVRAKYFEPWRCVLRHVVGIRRDLREAASDTLDPESPSFDNLGQLESIRRVLGSTDEVTDEQVREAESSAEHELSKFMDSLEIAYLYNQIDEAQREDLGSLARECKRGFYKRRDYGLWRQFLKALGRAIDDSAADASASLHERLQRCKDMLRPGEQSVLLSEAERLLDEDRNFAVAEDYLNRFEGGERTLPEAANVWFNEADDFAEFINPRFFDRAYRLCVDNGGRTLSSVARDLVKEIQEDGEKTGADGLGFLRTWPFEQNGVDKSKLSRFISALGMSVKSVESKDDFGGSKITLRPSPRHRTEYPHPIKEFGTQATTPLTVLQRVGVRTPDAIVSDVTKAGSALTLVLLDAPFSLSSRRKLAQILHTRSSGINKFILIDRVLAIYLATIERSMRVAALLKCSMPYSTFQPFVNGAGVTADEMFCGRKDELENIMAPDGATMVYGGRQLGKTALLLRARDLVHKPEDGQYSVWVDIDEVSDEGEVAGKISEKLAQVMPEWPDEPCESIEGICESAKRAVSSGQVSRILVLIDEADAFLDAIGESGYPQIRTLVRTMRETSNAFKFVLAGLHDVFRAKNAMEGNVVFGQMSSLCVEPLNPVDAMRLLMRPLTYLGFRIERLPHLQTIITNTNYYPGVIQLFGHELVNSLANGYFDYYGGSDEYPPFPLKREQLGAIISSARLNDEIQEELIKSLRLDKRYYMIARCIGLLYYDREDSESEPPSLVGLSAEDITACARDFDVEAIASLGAEELEVLLDEMVSMGILAKPIGERRRYRLRRQSFLEVIGKDSEEIVKDIINAQQEE